MKHGIIVAILKPNKERPYTCHFVQTYNTAKHRHITLLIKVIDLLVRNLITPYFLLLLTQDDFRPQHLTSTLLTQLTQDMLEDFNHKAAHKRKLLIAMDISKAFDAIPINL